MRAVGLTDLDLAARALMRVPDPRTEMLKLIREADLADRYRKRTGRYLGAGLDGSLGASASALGVAERPRRGDAEYLEAMAIVLQGLGSYRARAVAPLR